VKLYLLYLPGALFLLVVLFRVVVPWFRSPGWRRMINSAMYKRYRGDMEASNLILEKAIKRYPMRPEVYIEYFLHYDDRGNLQRKYEVLKEGFEKTENPAIGFFLGSGYLENGDYENASRFLLREDVRRYMLEKQIPLIVQYYYKRGEYRRAKAEYIDFYRRVYPHFKSFDELLSSLSPQELIDYVLILKALGERYTEVMDKLPIKSIRSEGGWKDYLSILRKEYEKLKPAVKGIEGDPGRFNRERKNYYEERISLIESYIAHR